MRLFWRLTPREFQALAARSRVRLMMEDARAGQIAALLAEGMRDRKVRPTPFTPADFFPSLRELEARQGAPPPSSGGRIDPELLRRDPEAARRNSERMLANAIEINKALGGRDRRQLAPAE